MFTYFKICLFYILFMYLCFMGDLGLRGCWRTFSTCIKWEPLFWCVGFSLHWLLVLLSMESRHMGFSSCGMGLVAWWHVGSSQGRDPTHVPCISRMILNHIFRPSEKTSIDILNWINQWPMNKMGVLRLKKNSCCLRSRIIVLIFGLWMQPLTITCFPRETLLSQESTIFCAEYALSQ